MSPIVNVLTGAACLLNFVTTGVLVQTEVPGETNNVHLHEPRNLPLALNADIRTLVGLGDGTRSDGEQNSRCRRGPSARHGNLDSHLQTVEKSIAW
jgi:hypothetical protein